MTTRRGGPRFLESMPKPLMAAFLVVAVGTLGLVLWLAITPPRFATVPLGERRPPPRGTLTHDVGRLVPAPIPTPPAGFEPPCPGLSGVRVEGGPPGVERFTQALGRLCGLFGPGVAPELAEALGGLDGATIRFAAFERTGVESTADLGALRIWLNTRFARSGSPFSFIGPLVVHEAWHLAHAGRPATAEEEFGARLAELAACRQLIARDRWPRSCRDAERLAALGRARAIETLVAEGYRRP